MSNTGKPLGGLGCDGSTGWKLVRHLPSASPHWHPINDNLDGTTTYGDHTKDEQAWSIDFNAAVPEWDEFMFASGDCTKWLTVSKEQAVGQFYADSGKQMIQSSNIGETNVSFYDLWYIAIFGYFANIPSIVSQP